MTVGRCLFSPLPPAFTAVPQYLVRITVVLLSLTEPDKRLSHTSGSSVRLSVRLRPTIGVEVFADPWFRPVHPGQCLVETFPGICLALALAVEPFKHNACGAIDIVAAPLQIVRYGAQAFWGQPESCCCALALHFSSTNSGSRSIPDSHSIVSKETRTFLNALWSLSLLKTPKSGNCFISSVPLSPLSKRTEST